MSDSQSHEMDEQPIIYQEQQVLWAKIRGYPWWPAFVDKVHGAKSNDDDEQEYTVFFFGDNTHSRLGASKLRRFLDYYTQFFPKAKTNRKLFLSIMKAEQKLKQNGGNVEIFQTLRNTMKKPKKGKGPYKTQSKISSQDHANNMLSQMPELIRNKTYAHNEQKQGKQIFSEEQQIMKQQRQQPKRRGRKPKRQLLKQQKHQQKMQEQQQQKSQSQKQQSEQQQSQGKKVGYRTRSRRGRRQVTYKVQDSKQQNKESQEEQQSQSENQQNNKKTYGLRVIPKTKPIIRASMPKKRGRPKKVIQQNRNHEFQQHSQSQQMNNIEDNLQQQKQEKLNNQIQGRTVSETRKTRNTFNRLRQGIKNDSLQQQNNEVQKQKQNNQAAHDLISQQKKELILGRIKFCLDKRQQLIQYIDELNVTTDIVKEILDLDVTSVILQGQTTVESIRVLHKLKSALLHKYFPEDIKIKKKYEKMSKKIQSRSTSEHQESLQDLQLRRKTIIKLQKILRSVDEGIDHKQKAVQIQLFFRRFDQNIGNSYKSIAYKVLRSLKDKNQTVDQVISKLESGEFDDTQK